jgi:hypothetical protein
VYQGCLKSKTVIAELDSAIHWQGKSKFNYFLKSMILLLFLYCCCVGLFSPWIAESSSAMTD